MQGWEVCEVKLVVSHERRGAGPVRGLKAKLEHGEQYLKYQEMHQSGGTDSMPPIR